MRSGSGVLCIAACQLLVGLCLLGIYEGYKGYYYNNFLDEEVPKRAAATAKGSKGSAAAISSESRVNHYEDPLSASSAMGFTFYLSIINNIFAIFGLAGVLNAQKELIIGFFSFNAAMIVVSFHYFVDLCTDAGIKYEGEPDKLTSYEQAAAAFTFFQFLLSLLATVFAVKAMDEVKAKQREDYNRLSVLSDTLQYETDNP